MLIPLINRKIPSWRAVHTIFFDFDGVFTDNKVWVTELGSESVRCDRADGLAFDMLRRFVIKKEWDLDCLIISTEKNPVVSSRAEKIKIKCFQGISNKSIFMERYLLENGKGRAGVVYVGNDLNDLGAMAIADVVVAPSDAHPIVLDKADIVLTRQGGDGCVREFIEMLIDLEHMSAKDLFQILNVG